MPASPRPFTLSPMGPWMHRFLIIESLVVLCGCSRTPLYLSCTGDLRYKGSDTTLGPITQTFRVNDASKTVDVLNDSNGHFEHDGFQAEFSDQKITITSTKGSPAVFSINRMTGDFQVETQAQDGSKSRPAVANGICQRTKPKF